MENFIEVLRQTLDEGKRTAVRNNWDYRRFGPERADGLTRRLKAILKSSLSAVGLFHNDVLRQITDNAENLNWLYQHLMDDESKDLLVKVMAYRVLGYRHVKLPLNTEAYWRKLLELDRRAAEAESMDLGVNGWRASKFDLSPDGFPIELFARPSGVFTQMLSEQYRCQLPDGSIEVEPGDVVVDAGGCYGDTALYFSHKAGESGRIYSFEFMPDNIRVFNKNMELNPALSGAVDLVERPLWSSSGTKLFVEGSGPATHVTSVPRTDDARAVLTLSIDDLLKEVKASKLDFIKMDIEGAELEALKGGVESIRKYRPKLAISIYHKLHDFWDIPLWIDSLGLGYRFAIRHFTIHAEETVLFAVADK